MDSTMTRPALIRTLGLGDATMLVIGCIVGAGIFRTASSIAHHLPSPPLILGLWALGGALSLCGALCYAELAAMFPKTGGDYIYLREVYGDFWGFLFGWTKLFIERTGTIAILGFVFAEYVRQVLGYHEPLVRWVATGAILILTAVNVVGIRWGTIVQNVFTVLKVVALACLIVAGAHALTSQTAPTSPWTIPSLNASLLQSMGVALIFVLWTYGGWTEAAYVAEEIKEPTRNVPIAIILGVIVTTVLYTLVNASYLLHLPIDAIAQTPLVASRVMESAIGPSGATFIAWMIAASAFGALNGYILTGGRILYAMAQHHRLFAQLATTHPTFHTPLRALWLNAAIAIALVFTKTFDQIMTYSTVVISVFFTMTVIGVMVLRRTRPRHPRPYRAWGYPWTPLAFVVTMLAFILDVCVKQPADAAFGAVALALGIPLYAWSRTVN